jgi:predicted O-methyltransferase YrrM
MAAVWNGAAVRWVRYRLGRLPAETQTTDAERSCLARYAAGRRCVVELGVMHGVTTALLRRAIAADGVVVGIDPHRPGRLGVSFERLVAQREVALSRGGRVVLLRRRSDEAAPDWRDPIDMLFIDADHSWDAIARDWRDWTPHVVVGGVVALHDSRRVVGRADFDSVRFTNDVVLRDPRFRVDETVDSLTVLTRVEEGPAA